MTSQHKPADPVETRGPEAADRSPEPADRREWIVLCDAQSGAHLTVAPYPVLPDTPIGIDRGDFEIVVAKSRFDAAMAAADERERVLEAERDKAQGYEPWDGERNAIHLFHRERERNAALTEALRGLGPFWEEDRTMALGPCKLVRVAMTEIEAMVYDRAVLLARSLAALPVPVAESDGRTDASEGSEAHRSEESTE